jgi:hypothetical protein
MAQPDWVAIFTRRPDLEPPGYAATLWRGSIVKVATGL